MRALYDSDILIWSTREAGLLRQRAGCGLVNGRKA
jgi:hypothetical protein